MFGSYLIELVIGMCFLFAVLGIVTSATTEAVLSVGRTRAAHLQEWLVQWSSQLLQQPGSQGPKEGAFSLEALKQHPLVASHARVGGEASYIPAEHLAAAFLQLLALPFSQACIGKDLPDAEKGLRAHIDGLHSAPLRQALHAVLNDAVGQSADGTALVEAMKNKTTQWIESSMSRIEGWTKRHAKKVSLAVALVICAALNVNALEVMRTLSADPQLRAQMASTAASYVPKACDGERVNASTEAKMTCLRDRTKDAVDALGPMTRLGIGWDTQPAFVTASGPFSKFGLFLVWCVGVACAALAASLGGDFWFKWIGDIVRLTGYKPRAKDAVVAVEGALTTHPILQRIVRQP